MISLQSSRSADESSIFRRQTRAITNSIIQSAPTSTISAIDFIKNAMSQSKSGIRCAHCDFVVPKDHKNPQSCLSGHLRHCTAFLKMKKVDGDEIFGIRRRLSTIIAADSSINMGDSKRIRTSFEKHDITRDNVGFLEFRPYSIEDDHILEVSSLEAPIVIRCRYEDNDGSSLAADLQPNCQYYKLQMLMDKEFYNDRLPFRTNGGKTMLDPVKDYESNGKDLLHHLRRGQNAQDLGDIAHCRPFDYAALANLSLRMHMSVADGDFLLETLNNIMRENEVKFRFPRTWRTINNAMQPFSGDDESRERVSHYSAPRFVDYPLDKFYWGEDVHAISASLDKRLDVPYGVHLDIVAKITQLLLDVKDPVKDFKHLPIAKTDGRRHKSFFGGSVCEQFYYTLLNRLKNYSESANATSSDQFPQIFSIDELNRKFEHTNIFVSFFEDKAAMQKNKAFGAEPFLMRILNIDNAMTLIGFPPDLKTSVQRLHAYLKDCKYPNNKRGVKTDKMRNGIIKDTRWEIKNRFLKFYIV